MTVFFDVDTQLDFLYPAGALYVLGAEHIVPRVAALNRYAADRGIPVISTMDAHTENDPEFRDWPPHCVAGTAGQHKPPSTLLEKRTVLPSVPFQVPLEGLQQFLLEKQSLDSFANPNLLPLLDQFAAEHCVVYGVVTEICVRIAALGLLKSGRRVDVVTDTVRGLDTTRCGQFFQELNAAGGRLVTSGQVTKQ
jgi:nicotinamidase/pyrazinamidase